MINTVPDCLHGDYGNVYGTSDYEIGVLYQSNDKSYNISVTCHQGFEANNRQVKLWHVTFLNSLETLVSYRMFSQLFSEDPIYFNGG